MTFRHLLRAVVPGVVAFVTGEPEVLDPLRTAERLRKGTAEHHIVRGARGSAKLAERPDGAVSG